MPSPRKQKPGSGLTHLNQKGEVHMVDVHEKEVSTREAKAVAYVRLRKDVLATLTESTNKKGDILATVRIAAIMAAKRTHELIPLCHPLRLNKVGVDIDVDAKKLRVGIFATVKCEGKTGVEMEAMTAASVGALTLYDMIKAVQRDAVIEEVRLLEKSGGKSGSYEFAEEGLRKKDKGKTPKASKISK